MKKISHTQLVEKGKEILLKAKVLYVDVDIEADGITGQGSILSLGAVAVTGEEFYKELQPIPGPYIPENREFCEKHGLNYEKLKKEGSIPKEAITEFGKWLKTLKRKTNKNLVMVGYNAGFDKSFIDLYFAKFNIPNPFEISPLDLMSLILPLVPEWDFNMVRKSSLPNILKIEREFTHNALEDAKYQQELHFAIGGWYSLNKF